MDGSTCIFDDVATLDCIFPMISSVINWALILSGSVAVIIILLGAAKYVISGGDSKRVESAKRTIGFAVLGLILLFLSFFIVNMIAVVTGITCISSDKPFSFERCDSGRVRGGRW